MIVKLNCLQVKNKLQEFYDNSQEYYDNGLLDDELQTHLDSCTECRNFYQNLNQLSSFLSSAFDQEIKKIKQPDFSEIFTKAKQIKQKNIYHMNFFRYGIAAVFVVLLSMGLLLFHFENNKNKDLVVDANRYLVEQVFDDSFFDGIEYVSLEPVDEDNTLYDLFDNDSNELENEESIISLFPKFGDIGKEL